MTKSNADAGDAKRFLKAHSLPAKRLIRLSSGFGVLHGVLIILSACVLAYMVNRAVFNDATPRELIPFAALFIGIQLLRGLSVYAGEMFGARAALSVKSQLRSQLMHALSGRQGGRDTGGHVTSLIEGLDALHGYYARYLPAMGVTVLLPLAILFFVFPVDYVSAIVMLVTAPLIPFFMVLIGQGAERLNQRQWRRLTHMGGYMLDRLQGITSLKLAGASRREADAIGQMGESYRHDTMAVLRVAFLSSLALEFFATLSIAIVAVLLGFRLLWGAVAFEHAYLVLLLAPEFYLPLRRMGAHYHARMEAIGAVERILPFLQSSPVADAPHPAPTTPPRVSFADVCAAYDDGKPVLQHIDFTLEAGESLALVGASGCGKSTLLSLLLRFIEPQSGTILIDGVPLSTIDRERWWQSLGWVPQRPHLIWGSAADNIRLASPGLSDERLALLAQQLGIDFLHQATQEHGSGLSGGQVRRVAVARALARPAPLLLLDEPTAHLDAASEHCISRTLEAHGSGRTRIIAAHRFASIGGADKLLLLDQGRMLGFGTHASLAEESAHYRAWAEEWKAA